MSYELRLGGARTSFTREKLGESEGVGGPESRRAGSGVRAEKTLRIAALLALLALLGVGGGCGSVFRKKLVFTREQIQKKIAPRFPLKEKMLLGGLTLSDPQVVLKSGAERIGMRLHLEAELPGVGQYGGELEVDGEIEYRGGEGAFYLARARLRRLEVEGLSGKYRALLEGVADEAVGVYLSKSPLYQLDPKSFKQSLAKLLLKSVRVEDGQVVVEVGL